MNKLLFLLTFICINLAAQAQVYFDKHWDIKAHEQGQVHFRFGIGLPLPTYNSDSNLFMFKTIRIGEDAFDKYKKQELGFDLYGSGPWYARFEYGFSRKFSAELGVTYINNKAIWTRMQIDPLTGAKLPYEYGVSVNNISAIARVNYHIYIDTRWDWYIGGGLGYDYYGAKDFTKYAPDTAYKAYFTKPAPVTFEAAMGARYFFLSRTAWYIEAGYGKTYVNTGVVVKVSQPKLNRSY